MEKRSSLLGTLFDLSFQEFITTRLVRAGFILCVIGAAVLALMLVPWLISWKGWFLGGCLSLVLAPSVFLLVSILARLLSEFVIVFFQIAENTARLAPPSHAENARSAAPQGASIEG